jgi:hypothetical protein
LIVNQNKFKFCKYIENSPVLRLALLYSDLVPSVSHCPISLVYFTTELLSRAAHTYHLYDVFSSSASVPTDASPGKVIFPDQDQSQASSGWTDPSPPPGNSARKRTTLPWVLHSLEYHTPLGTTLPWVPHSLGHHTPLGTTLPWAPHSLEYHTPLGTTLPWVPHSLGHHTPLGTTLPWVPHSLDSSASFVCPAFPLWGYSQPFVLQILMPHMSQTSVWWHLLKWYEVGSLWSDCGLPLVSMHSTGEGFRL